MRLSHITCDIEITSVVFASMSFSCHSQGHTIVYTSWYIDSLFYFFLYPSLSMTFLAGIVDFCSCPTTFVTDDCLLHDTKYTSCRTSHISRSMAGGTFFWFFTISCSMSMTCITVHHFIEMDFFFYTRKTLCERNMYFFLYIFTTFISALSSRTAKSTHVSKHRRENILHIDITKIKPSKSSSEVATFRASELIITGFFLSIREHSICFINCLEFVFLCFVSTVSIWMRLHSFFSVCFFYFFRRSISLHSENRIIVFTHA